MSGISQTARKRRMIAQRQNVQSRLKCCLEKGLTCPRTDAYDWLFE
jgi:hypothetical protein